MNEMKLRAAYRQEISWPVISSSLWLRLAFVGAAFIAYGIASAMAGELGLAPALGYIAGGGSVATFALRRSFQVLEEVSDKPSAKPRSGALVTLQTSKV